MIDKKFFSGLRKGYASYDAARRDLIKSSGDVLTRAKQAIFAFHRGDATAGSRLLKEAAIFIEKTAAALKKNKGLEYEGSYRAALEEYVEARLVERFLEEKMVGGVTAPGVDEDVFLGGVMDFTGELVRYATNAAARRDVKEVKRAHDAVISVMAELILMNITGPLRSKYDQAKTNLRKLEEIRYDLSLRK